MPPRFLSIKNFEKYQHFKKANPPWIKLYKSIFTDRAFMLLPISSKYLFIGLLSLASEGDNRVVNDPSWIAHRLAISPSDIDLKPLYKSGFLIASDSTVRRYKVSLREETETETETEERRGDDAPATHNGVPPKRGKRPISEEDKPTEKHFAFGKSLGVDVGPEWGKFKNYCLAHDKRYANYEAAFRNWLANAAAYKEKAHVVR